MSGKRNKLIRKVVDFQPHAPRLYKDTPVKTKFVATGRVDTDGKDIMNPVQCVTRTSTGSRSAYQELKRS